MAAPSFKLLRELLYKILPNYVGSDRASQDICDHISYEIFKFLRGDLDLIEKKEEPKEQPIEKPTIIPTINIVDTTGSEQVEFNERVLSCKRCAFECINRGPVPPNGKWKSPLMIIGEAPGMAEDFKGIPLLGGDEFKTRSPRQEDCISCVNVKACYGWFLGERDNHFTRSCMGYGHDSSQDIGSEKLDIFKTAGNLLDDCLKKVYIDRSKILITNTVMCRPSENNDPPTNMQIVNCAPYLMELIKLNQPEVIVAMGNSTLRLLKPKNDGILAESGKPFRWQNTIVIPTYHPSYVLRQKQQNVLSVFINNLIVARDNLSVTAKESILLNNNSKPCKKD